MLPASDGLHYRGVSSLMRSLTSLAMAAEKLNRLIATNTPMPQLGEKALTVEYAEQTFLLPNPFYRIP